MTRRLRSEWLTAIALIALVAGACTMKKQEAPPLTGPSEYGTSITVEVTPDVITQDGASQSLITVIARDANGQPVRNISFRIETIVNNANVDFGTLSARTIVTGTDGRATAIYTAPAGNLGGSEVQVTIRAVPIGSDVNNAVARSALIRLVPQGVVVPPSTLTPSIAVSPASPVEDAAVLLDASASRSSNTCCPITSYTWDFGNGETASGVRATTTYREPGTYFVTLTIADDFGRSASTTATVTVIGGTAPTPQFTYSPIDPVAGDQVNFNASTSTAPAGRRIVRYQWDFGDGSPRVTSTSPVASHTYTIPRTYTVTLTVRDDTGREASTSSEVEVAAGPN